jgi:hypothetical protein
MRRTDEEIVNWLEMHSHVISGLGATFIGFTAIAPVKTESFREAVSKAMDKEEKPQEPTP